MADMEVGRGLIVHGKLKAGGSPDSCNTVTCLLAKPQVMSPLSAHFDSFRSGVQSPYLTYDFFALLAKNFRTAHECKTQNLAHEFSDTI